MDAHVWAPTGMVKDQCGTWYYSIDVAEELTAIRTDCASYRRYADQAREELTALRQRVRELEAELVAEREAVRVLARYMYENGRGCGNRTYTERLDDLQVHFSNVIANPLAAAAVRRAGGEA